MLDHTTPAIPDRFAQRLLRPARKLSTKRRNKEAGDQRGSNAGEVTLTIQGAKFNTNERVQIISADSTATDATRVRWVIRTQTPTMTAAASESGSKCSPSRGTDQAMVRIGCAS